MSQDPDLALARHVLSMQWLPRERVREALLLREQARAAGRPVDLKRVLTSGYLRPEHVAELSRSSDPWASVASQGEPLAAAALQRAAELARRPATDDPPAVQQFLSALAAFGDRATVSLAPAAPPPGRLGAAPPLSRSTAAPRTLGPFQVERELGRGGMGAVFVAYHPGLDRQVAIKVVLGFDPGRLKRFQVEARACARLRHPNIVGVHEVGVEQGQPYLVMDLIEGTTLSARLEAGPLEPREAARLVATLARALDYAHRRGVLHRDLKPSNVLLDLDGEPVLTDFGLAKETDAESLTKTGQVLGTPAYMPPEQATGKKELVDARSDVYSLGVTLYELLTGRVPFTGDGALQLIVAICQATPEPPSRHRPGLDPALDAIVLRCLAKAPKDRPASAAALADLLEGWLGPGAAAVHAPAGRSGGLGLGVVAGIAAVVAVVAAGALGGLAWTSRRAASSAVPEREAPVEPRAQALARAAAADARGWPVEAEEARWEALALDPLDVTPLASIVRARLEADDAVGLARLWDEVHRRLGPRTLLREARADEPLVAATLRDRAAPAGARTRAALAAARHRRPEVLEALASASAEVGGPPLVAEAARATLLRLAPPPPEGGLPPLSAWAERAVAEPEGALQALTLLEHAASADAGDRSALGKLAREARGPLLRAAVPLALAVAVTRSGGPPQDLVRAALTGLAGDADPLVAARARTALGAVLAASGEEPDAGLAAWRLARDLVLLPGALPELRDGGPWRRALQKAAERGPPALWGLLAADAVERGDDAQLGRALAAAGDDPLARELELQLRVARDPAAAGEPVAADPGERARAQARLELVRRHGLPALPAPNGCVRVTVAAAAPWAERGLTDGLDATVAAPRPGHHRLEAEGPMVLRSRLGLQAWHVLRVVGQARRKDDAAWLALDELDERDVETGLRGRVQLASTGAVLEQDGQPLGDVPRPEPRAPREEVELELEVRRAEAVLRRDGEALLRRALPARRLRGDGRAFVEWAGAGGRVQRLAMEGRWDPAASAPAPPTPDEVQARLARLVPLDGRTRVVGENLTGAMPDLAALRREQMMEAIDSWIGGSRRASLVAVPGLVGDVEVRARLTFTPKGGQQAGLALRGGASLGDALLFGPGFSDGTVMALHAQRGNAWERPLRYLPARSERFTLSLARLGDHVVVRWAPGDEPLQPFLGVPLRYPFAGPLDVVLFARSYDPRTPATSAYFDRVEVLGEPR